MKKVVISGSASLQDATKKWIDYWKNYGYEIIDYPKPIKKEEVIHRYPQIHKEFYQCTEQTNVLFIMNEDKKGISGYIGASTFAELAFAVALNSIYNKNIEILLLKMPSLNVQCYEEIKLWLSLGWIKLLKQ